ncbi:MAG: hypothetical protein ABI867_36475 [Kofleriaceae bacterium]
MNPRWLLALVIGCASPTPPPQAPQPTQQPVAPAPTPMPAPAPAPGDEDALVDATPASQAAGTQGPIAAKLNEEGKTAMYAGNFADASKKFREAVSRVPEPAYFFNFCVSLYQEGKFGEALVACQAARKNDPPPALEAKVTTLIARITDEARRQGVDVR